MKENAPDRPSRRMPPAGRSASAQTAAGPPPATLQALYLQSKADRWGLSRERFGSSLERSAEKRMASGNLAPERLEEYLSALHLEDLALATACMENCEPAWEHFVTSYRPYLRAAAAAVLRCSS